VREHLATDGWQIVSMSAPDQHGTDLVPLRDRTRLEVEAEGAGNLGRIRHGTASHSPRPRSGSMLARQCSNLSLVASSH
jgi:hypothetical protein